MGHNLRPRAAVPAGFHKAALLGAAQSGVAQDLLVRRSAYALEPAAGRSGASVFGRKESFRLSPLQ